MTVENAVYIGDLVATSPTPNDPESEGDDQLRLIKAVLQSAFPGFAGSIIATAADTGSANAYVLTPTIPLPSYVVGMMLVLKPTSTNTTAAPTVNVSGLGAKAIRAVDGSALVAGDLQAGLYFTMIYDGAQFKLAQVTKNYVDQSAFNATLPGQPGGNAPYNLTSRNGVATFTPQPAGVNYNAYDLGAA